MVPRTLPVHRGGGICVLFLYLSEPFLFQPLTHRQIVELVGSVCHKDGKQEYADGDEEVCAERCILMVVHPLTSKTIHHGVSLISGNSPQLPK